MNPAPARVRLRQFDTESEISGSGIEQQTVIEVLRMKYLPELLRSHQVVAFQFILRGKMTVHTDLLYDMHCKLPCGV